MSTTLKPLGDRVVVEPLREDESKKTKSGIIIPETVDKERPERGKIIATGPGRVNDQGVLVPLSVKKGQIVIFSKYGPDEIKIEGKKLFILSESHILAVVEE
jgi:chaperonin GroES